MFTNKTKSNLKIVILTTTHGIFATHYLVKNLNVVGIVIDRNKKKSKTSWEKIKLIKKNGLKWVFVIAKKKIFNKLFGSNIQRAMKSQNKYLRSLDRIFLNHSYYQKRLEYQDFVDWDELSNYYNIPIVYTENINNDFSAKMLSKWKPDLAIVIGGRIVESHIIQIPRIGILNKHSSILPKHRGIAAEYWCLYYEDFNSLGITVHYLKAGLDNGPILIQKRMKFEKKDIPTSLRFKSSIIGREAIVEAVKMIEETGAKGVPQDELLATHNKRPNRETDRKLYSKLPKLWEKYGK